MASNLGVGLVPLTTGSPLAVDYLFSDYTGNVDFSNVCLIGLIVQFGNAVGTSNLVVTNLSAHRTLSIAGQTSFARRPRGGPVGLYTLNTW